MKLYFAGGGGDFATLVLDLRMEGDFFFVLDFFVEFSAAGLFGVEERSMMCWLMFGSAVSVA